jgi:hypothetical protein
MWTADAAGPAPARNAVAQTSRASVTARSLDTNGRRATTDGDGNVNHMPSSHAFAALSVWLAAATLVAQAPGAGDFRPPPAPEQPIAFSHKTHVEQGLACTSCHSGADKEDRASLPATATCMSCHGTVRADSPEIQKLAAFHAKGEVVPWRRVYRLPAYVYFSHVVHAPADQSVRCDTCHGVVGELTVMQKLKDTSMATCVQCHTERRAITRCDGCHEPR